MNDVLQTIAVLLAAISWGGVVVMSLLVMPTSSMIPHVEHEIANTVANYFHRLLSFTLVPLHLLILIAVVVGEGDQTVILPAVFLLILAGLDAGFLERSLVELQKPTLSPEERANNRRAVSQLQYAQMASDLFKITLGGILIVMLVNF
jgi:hypothetical protein